MHAGEIVFRLDSDHDGMSDEDELAFGLDPNDPSDADADPDGDGLSNGAEISIGTNPTNADTDGDGFADGLEVQTGYDPLDPASHPATGTVVTRIELRPGLLNLTLNPFVDTPPFQLAVRGIASDGSETDLTTSPATTYESSDLSVVGVDASGQAFAISDGTATITARNGQFSAQSVAVVSVFFPEANGFVKLPGFANEIDVVGTTAYIACGAAGLQVVDVSLPYAPVVIGALALPGIAADVRVVGSIAYLACSVGGLQVVDVSDPSAPVLMSAVGLEGRALDVCISGQLAYVAADEAGLEIVDIADPSLPTVVGSLRVVAGDRVTGVDIDSTRAVAALAQSGTNEGVRLVDVVDPQAPQALGFVAVPGARDLSVSGTIVHAAAANGLVVVDAGNPDALVILPSPSSRAATGFEERDGIGFLSIDSFLLGAVVGFDVSNPAAPVSRGRIDLNPILARGVYQHVTGQAIEGPRLFVTASRTVEPDAPASGDTALFVVQFDRSDAGLSPPAVSIVYPPSGTALVAGEPPVTVVVTASDDIAVAGVEILGNGVVLAALSAPPYVATLSVPSEEGSVVVEARALDNAGNLGTASVTVPVVTADPRTTLTGRVVYVDGSPAAFAIVTLQDGSGRTEIASEDGTFMFPGVATVPLDALVHVAATDSSGELRGQSRATKTIRGGVSDVGLVVVAKRTTTLLPTSPSAFGVMGFTSTVSPDLFIGFADRQSLVYSSDGQGGYSANASFTLPFVAARAGVATLVDGDLNFDVLAQAVGQNGVVASVRGDGQGGVLGSLLIGTGLAGESELVAAGYEPNGFPSRSIAAFAASDGVGGTTISVRIRDGAGQFAPLATLRVAGTVRTLAVEDVTADGLLDIVASQQVSGTEGRLVVFPRTGVTEFGPEIVSTILIRGSAPTGASVDFILGDVYLDANGNGVDLMVLGDDRVRVYTTDGTGAFVVEDEIALPGDVMPTGLGARRFGGGVAYVVVGRRAGTSEGQVLLVYSAVRGEAARFEFEAPPSEGDMRVAIGEFGEPGLADVLIVDSDRITTFLGVGPRTIVDKGSDRPSTHRYLAGGTTHR